MWDRGPRLGVPPDSGGRNGCGVVRGSVWVGRRGWCEVGVQRCQVGCSGRLGNAGSGQGQCGGEVGQGVDRGGQFGNWGVL